MKAMAIAQWMWFKRIPIDVGKLKAIVNKTKVNDKVKTLPMINEKYDEKWEEIKTPTEEEVNKFFKNYDGKQILPSWAVKDNNAINVQYTIKKQCKYNNVLGGVNMGLELPYRGKVKGKNEENKENVREVKKEGQPTVRIYEELISEKDLKAIEKVGNPIFQEIKCEECDFKLTTKEVEMCAKYGKGKNLCSFHNPLACKVCMEVKEGGMMKMGDKILIH